MFNKLFHRLLFLSVLLVSLIPQAMAQTKVVAGLVVDAAGNPLPGVTI